MNVYQLSYKSRATSTFDSNELDSMLATAIRNNERANISGCLVYYKNCFIQILEGSKEDVIALYKIIEKDIRHDDFNLLWEGEVDKRYFADWGMAYHSSTESEKFFKNNLLLLSKFSDKSTATLLTFWLTVKEVLESED